MEPAMSDKSIAAIATTGTDKIRFTLSASIDTARSSAAQVATLAATPPFPIAWRLGWAPELQLQALGQIASGSLTKYVRANSKE
jgi:hypothetical protein